MAFSEGLQSELNGSGVYVQALCPGYTHTEFHSTEDFQRFKKEQTPGFIWLNAADVVRDSLNDIGSGRVVVVPNVMYKTLVTLLRTPVLGDLMLKVAAGMRARRRAAHEHSVGTGRRTHFSRAIFNRRTLCPAWRQLRNPRFRKDLTTPGPHGIFFFTGEPKWRNWQTRYVQGVVGISSCGFKSLLRHLIEETLSVSSFFCLFDS